VAALSKRRISESEAGKLDAEIRARKVANGAAPQVVRGNGAEKPIRTSTAQSGGTLPEERQAATGEPDILPRWVKESGRPIEPIEDSSGRETYVKEKLAWLQQVACDPRARLGLPLATVLTLRYLGNFDGQCNPGDKILTAGLEIEQRQLTRWRRTLIDAGT
jgi:hypothetical protein